MADQKKTSEPFLLPSDLEEQRSIVERPEYKPRSTFRLPSEAVPEKPDYEQMPLSEAAYRGLKSAPQSLVNAVLGLPQMIMQPSETLEGIKAIGKGALSSAAEKQISALEAGAAGETGKQIAAEWRAKNKITPQQKAEIEDPYKRFIAPYTSMAGFKETLATDPFAVVPLGGGPIRKAGALARGADTSSLARKIIAAPVTAAGYAVDPMESALSLTGGVLGGAKRAIKSDWSGIAQVPEEAVDIAYMTAKSRGPEADLAKKSFADSFNGQIDVDNFQTRTINAFEKIKTNAFNQWKKQKAALMGQAGDVPFKPILDAIDERRAIYGNYDLATDEGRSAIDALNRIKGNIMQRSMLPEGHPDRSIEALDSYKIQLGMEANANPALSNDFMAAYNGVKKSLNEVAPEYQNLMDTYREMNRHMTTLQKSVKAKDTATAVQSLQSFYKLLKTPEGIKIAKEINAVDPTILPSVAGSALSREAPLLQGFADKTGIGAALLTVAGGLAAGYPEIAALGAGATVALRSAQTPRNLGRAAMTAGEIAGSPVGKTAAGVGSFARQTATPVTTFMENLRRTQEDIEKYPEIKSGPFEVTVPVGIQPPRASGGRVARADGGRIDVERGVRALMRAAENAKKNISKTTETLLDQPDEHIAQALNVAKRHI